MSGRWSAVGAATRRGVRSRARRRPRRVRAHEPAAATRSGAVPLLGGVLRRAAPTFAARPARRSPGAAALVHSNGNKTHLLSLPLALGGVPLVWHVRDFLRDRGPGAAARAPRERRFAGALIANSAAVAEHLDAWALAPALVHAIPNGIDLARFTADGPRADLRAAFGWPPAARVVGMVGVLARWKGQEVFLRAARELVARDAGRALRRRGRRDLHDRAGTASSRRACEASAARWGWTARRRLHRRTVTTCPRSLRALDVVVHASLEPEPFGRRHRRGDGLRAADRVGAGRRRRRDRRRPPGSWPSASAAATWRAGRGDRAALSEPERVRSWAGEGRRRVVERFDVREHVARVQELYAQVAAGRA